MDLGCHLVTTSAVTLFAVLAVCALRRWWIFVVRHKAIHINWRAFKQPINDARLCSVRVILDFGR
jgi:hypothetical protein